MSFSVGQVARLADITVRTLHHYDEIGLLTPGERTRTGYRRYTDDDLVRLQQILLYRELGFPLDEIAVILDEPHTDELTHLRRQHELLTRKARRLQEVIAAVERAINARNSGITLTPEERFEIFGDHRPEDHDAEAERRWGHTDAYAQSRRRVATYTKADWLQLKAEAATITGDLIAACKAGLPADGTPAMDLAERHRGHITRWFYDCPHDLHRCLGDLYVQDPRFTATFDGLLPGLATYLRHAIHANARRHTP
ncbi:MerR family transcriptional regulator [Nonomuraea gerenzanensis]|uniref:HTH-type transcriptional activator tipA n=1 Tax=Nonomuraea gerenzanensis TaxID=93944 RepID=A0A1M4EC08_9ACTN|nr:MerR family transcriptional regulator [Nonomuraea gerenzanensis]UBU18640.1 MerR family transcriptional regulator [Nonomuraea gerenzanensis]SBO96491.1 HTH-type transcriptional activator tipA [Nonomuraea gerenzanensis]